MLPAIPYRAYKFIYLLDVKIDYYPTHENNYTTVLVLEDKRLNKTNLDTEC